MRKIIIDPHNCSREEYQELVDYLEDKCWDYQKEGPEDKEVNYILKGGSIHVVGSNGVTLNDKIREEELFEYGIAHRESLIDDLYRWIGETKSDSDKQMMKDDVRMLEDWEDDYIFSSVSTNAYIGQHCPDFDRLCEELIKINEVL